MSFSPATSLRSTDRSLSGGWNLCYRLSQERSNETGFFTLTASGAVPGPPAVSDECGVLTITSQSLTFAGRTLTFQEGYQTTFCGSLTIAATLTR